MLENFEPSAERAGDQRTSAGDVRERGAEHARPLAQQPDRGPRRHLPRKVAAGAQPGLQQLGDGAEPVVHVLHRPASPRPEQQRAGAASASAETVDQPPDPRPEQQPFVALSGKAYAASLTS